MLNSSCDAFFPSSESRGHSACQEMQVPRAPWLLRLKGFWCRQALAPSSSSLTQAIVAACSGSTSIACQRRVAAVSPRFRYPCRRDYGMYLVSCDSNRRGGFK